MRAHEARFVGRDHELAQMREMVADAAAGRPGVVLVSGEPGIGKTRLVEQVIADAIADGFLTAVGHCSPVSGSRLPYGPVVDLVQDLIRQRPQWPDLVRPEVRRSVYWLTGVGDEPPAGSAVDVASARLFAGFAELLLAISDAQPVLLAVEDLHWADPASVDLLLFAARKLRNQHILLVLTNRRDGAPPRSPVRLALASLRRLPTVSDIALQPLTGAAMVDLLDSLPEKLPAEVRRQITAVCDGVPFFALHLALHGDGRAVPPGLRDVLLTSVDDLTATERSVLILLSVLDIADHDAFLAAAGVDVPDPVELDRLIRRLVDKGLIVVNDESAGFRHALLREVVVDDTLPSERVIAHARAADGLLASPARNSPGRAVSLAHHLLGCGRYGDAIGYAVQGARQAARVWAFSEAQNLLAAACRLWPLIDNPEVRAGIEYPELLKDAALAGRWCGQFDQAEQLLDQALALAGLTDRQRAELHHALGQVLWAAGDTPGALIAYEKAAETLAGTGADSDRTSLAIMAALAQGQMATGSVQRAETTALAAIKAAKAAGADRERIHAGITLAVAHAQRGDVESAVADLQRCLLEARRLDDLELVVRCYGNMTFALGLACRYDALAAVAAEGTEVCRRYGPVISVVSTMINNQVSALIELGRWDEAVEVTRAALSDITAPAVALLLRTRLAEIAVARGDAAEADRQLADAGELGIGNPYALSAISVVKAELALAAHDSLGAVLAIDEVLEKLGIQDDVVPLLQACWLGLRARADRAENTVPTRRAVAAESGPDLLAMATSAVQRTELPSATALYLACQAEAARIDRSDSPDQWAAAAAANRALNLRYALAYCLFRLAAVHLRRQARAQAARVIGEARALAQDLGAVPLSADLDGLIAVSGLRAETAHSPADSAHSPADSNGEPADFGLTRRERQVLDLLTAGATNRIIARTLFISESTASVHVSNILAKLGAGNRTEAARIAVRLPRDHRSS